MSGAFCDDVEDESSTGFGVHRSGRSAGLMESGKVSEGMIPKLEAVLTSLQGGGAGGPHNRWAHRSLGATRDHDRRRRAGHQR